jgi:hypothetical protein
MGLDDDILKEMFTALTEICNPGSNQEMATIVYERYDGRLPDQYLLGLAIKGHSLPLVHQPPGSFQ